MSKFVPQPPIVHLPSYKRWGIQRHYYVKKLEALGVKVIPENIVLDAWYWYSNLEGWQKVCEHLLIKSSLYKKTFRDCDNLAFEAQELSSRLYRLNSLRFACHESHAFNVFPVGDETGIKEILVFEPNEGYDYDVLGIVNFGDFGYRPLITIA